MDHISWYKVSNLECEKASSGNEHEVAMHPQEEAERMIKLAGCTNQRHLFQSK